MQWKWQCLWHHAEYGVVIMMVLCEHGRRYVLLGW
jgi:hypothetical protein